MHHSLLYIESVLKSKQRIIARRDDGELLAKDSVEEGLCPVFGREQLEDCGLIENVECGVGALEIRQHRLFALVKLGMGFGGNELRENIFSFVDVRTFFFGRLWDDVFLLLDNWRLWDDRHRLEVEEVLLAAAVLAVVVVVLITVQALLQLFVNRLANLVDVVGLVEAVVVVPGTRQSNQRSGTQNHFRQVTAPSHARFVESVA